MSVAGAIGKRLAEMHSVLARPSDDPAFAPETATARDVEAWIERATALLDRAFALVKGRKSRADEAVEAQAELLLSQQSVLTKALHRLARAGVGSPKTRIHGDFHLGQVLVATGDVYIIDFEGEPGRPLAERRAKASPLRDVAGLVRSFDYAAAATLDPKNVTAARLSAKSREVFLTRLRDGAQKAFLDSYYASIASAKNADLLDFFLIEKAAYELAYEAANRPAWLQIPISGLSGLAARILRSAERSAVMNVLARTQTPPLDRSAARNARARVARRSVRRARSARHASGPVVRACLPGAESVDVLRRSDGARLGHLEQSEPDGLFEGPVSETSPYLLRITWPGAIQDTEDPYSFGPLLGDLDLHLFSEGRHFKLAEALGANVVTIDGVRGTRFAVWAPNAQRVAVIGDFNTWDARRHPMRLRHSAGIWELFVPRVAEGARYKFDIIGAGGMHLPSKADPVARQAEVAPATASVVASPEPFRWRDADWMASRAARHAPDAPQSVYEMHLGSWMRPAHDAGATTMWEVAIDRLIPYLVDLGFTHVELLPITEHPLAALGATSRSACSRRRHATARRWFRALRRCAAWRRHRHHPRLGAGAFPRRRAWLARFDGTALYEHLDPREGFHRDWNTYIYISAAARCRDS